MEKKETPQRNLRRFCCGEGTRKRNISFCRAKRFVLIFQNISFCGLYIVGQAAIPIPIVGAMVGSMVGYSLSSAFYKELTTSLKDAKFARENRIQIEKECDETIKYIQQCREEMNRIASQYLSDYQNVFNSAFSDMDSALLSGNIDLFIFGANKITKKLGGTIQYENMNEFKSFMDNDEISLIL